MEHEQKIELFGKMTGHISAMKMFLQGDVTASEAVSLVDVAIVAETEKPSNFYEYTMEDLRRAKSAFQACVEFGLTSVDFKFT